MPFSHLKNSRFGTLWFGRRQTGREAIGSVATITPTFTAVGILERNRLRRATASAPPVQTRIGELPSAIVAHRSQRRYAIIAPAELAEILTSSEPASLVLPAISMNNAQARSDREVPNGFGGPPEYGAFGLSNGRSTQDALPIFPTSRFHSALTPRPSMAEANQNRLEEDALKNGGRVMKVHPCTGQR
jgi:hypothetical protein